MNLSNFQVSLASAAIATILLSILFNWITLKKTKDSILINTTNLSKRSCFLKIKKIIDKKLKIDGNI